MINVQSTEREHTTRNARDFPPSAAVSNMVTIVKQDKTGGSSKDVKEKKPTRKMNCPLYNH